MQVFLEERVSTRLASLCYTHHNIRLQMHRIGPDFQKRCVHNFTAVAEL